MRALQTSSLTELIDAAVAVVAEELHADLAGMLEASPVPDTFVFRSGVGWREGIIGAITKSQPGSAVEFMLQSDGPVVYGDLPRETRFTPPRLLLDHGVRGGVGVIVRGREGVLGVLGVHARAPHHFAPDDANFLQTIANVLSEAMERATAEMRLRAREERFRRLAEDAHDIIYRYRLLPEPAFEYVNPAVERVTGYSQAECYASPRLAFDMIHPDDRATLLADGNTSGDPPGAVRYVRKDGGIVWCELRTVPVHDDSGVLIAVECIARDVTERKRVEDQLRAAYERERHAAEQLRGLDTMKNAFLQAVSHELRTPLAAVLGMAVTLEQRGDELSREDRDLLLGRLAVNARALDGLLTDLLDLDRLMRRTIEPQRRPTLLLRQAKDVAADADTDGRAVHISGEDLVVNVDTPKTERIIDNLLANAIRHTPLGASIWIDIRRADGGAEIVVEDDGPGIPDEMKREVFEPFRTGPSLHAHAPGTGMGLALVAKFAELHGGRAWATDRIGGGASIHVLLPDG